MMKQRYTQDNNTIHKRPTTVSRNAHKKSKTMRRKYCYWVLKRRWVCLLRG